MLTWIAAGEGVALLVLVGTVVFVLLGRGSLLREHLRDRFVITLTSGETFSGLLWQDDACHVVFEDAKTLMDGRWVSVDGRLWLDRSRIAYMQCPEHFVAGDDA